MILSSKKKSSTKLARCNLQLSLITMKLCPNVAVEGTTMVQESYLCIYDRQNSIPNDMEIGASINGDTSINHLSLTTKRHFSAPLLTWVFNLINTTYRCFKFSFIFFILLFLNFLTWLIYETSLFYLTCFFFLYLKIYRELYRNNLQIFLCLTLWITTDLILLKRKKNAVSINA